MGRIKYLLLYLFLTLNFNYGQTWQRFVNWNEGECIASINDSIFWVGTKVGLVKWDIKNNLYQTFDNEDGLQCTAINDLSFDRNGNLWMATDDGIIKYDGLEFEIFNFKNVATLPKTSFVKLIVDSNNNIYAGTANYIHNNNYHFGSIVSYYHGQWKIFHGNDFNFSWFVTDMVIYKDKLIIAIPYQSSYPIWGTKFYTFENNELLKISDCEINIYGHNFTVDYEDSLWFSSERFLYKYRGGTWEEIINGDKENIGSLWKYAWSDNNGGLWLGGYKWGLYHINIEDNREGIIYTHGLPPGIKRIIDYDTEFNDYQFKNGAHFFVSKKGLGRLNGNQLSYGKIEKTIEQNEIFGLGKSQNNDIYVSGPLSTQIFDGDKWEIIGDLNSGESVYNNDFRFSPKDQLFTNHNSHYPNLWTRGLDFDGEGNLWTTHPVTKYRWPNLSPFRFTNDDMGQDKYPNTKDVIVDKFNHIWFAVEGGDILMNDGSRWHSYNAEIVGVPYIDLDYVFADSKGRKWFACNTTTPNWGLIMYDNENWNVFNFPELSRGQYIYQVSEDNFGNLWFASQAGLLKYDNKYWYIYDSENMNVDFSTTNAVTVDQRGNVWIGTTKGLYLFNPSGIDLNSDISISPLDSLNILRKDGITIAKAHINNILPRLRRIELQRGIKPHKFWTISYKDFPYTDQIELTDNSLAVGSTIYRIKAVDIDGRAYYSDYKNVGGDSVKVNIFDFTSKKEGADLFLYWKTKQELHVEYFEIYSSDTTNSNRFLFTKVLAQNNNSDGINQYKIIGEELIHNAPDKMYSINAIFSDSTSSASLTIRVNPSLPENFNVSKNYPNPFNSVTNVNITLPSNTNIKVEIYNIIGQLVKVILDEEYQSGIYTIPITLNNFPSGVYIYKIIAGNEFIIGKMILLK